MTAAMMFILASVVLFLGVFLVAMVVAAIQRFKEKDWGDFACIAWLATCFVFAWLATCFVLALAAGICAIVSR